MNIAHNIVVNIKAITYGFNKGIKEVDKSIKNLNKRLNRLGNLKQYNKTAMKLGASFGFLEEKAKKFYEGASWVEKGLIKSHKDLGKDVSKIEKLGAVYGELTSRFQAWALSMMFTGMLMKRTFDLIMRSGVNSFTKIMESSGYFGSAIQKLGVHWEYLKFTVGSAINRALEPLIPLITKIINKFADFVREHPKFTAAILAIGSAIGTLLMFGGMLVLNMTWLSPVIKTLGKGFLWLGKHAIKFLGKMLQWLGKVFVWLYNNPIAIIVAGIVYFTVAILRLKEKLGSWGEFFKSVLRGVLRVAVIIWDALVSAFRWVINKIIEGLNWIIDQVNKLLEKEWVQKGFEKLGVELKVIPTISKIKGSYGDILEKYFNWEEKKLAPKKGYLSPEELAYLANPLTLMQEQATEAPEAPTTAELAPTTTITINNMKVEAQNWEEFINELKRRSGVIMR